MALPSSPVALSATSQASTVEIAKTVAEIAGAVDTVIRGKREVVEVLLTALFARGHVLIEDVPGVGKTTLARALARCLGGTFRRIQFTSDLLPSDIIGVSVFDPERQTFEFKQGPIFANIVLADEINRTSPRTQSSLMEALNEGQVTVDHHTYTLEDPFLVLGTQNPLEHFGTYPLPESELDRFLLRISVGYPSEEDEQYVIAHRGGYDRIAGLSPIVTAKRIVAIQKQVDHVEVDPALLEYVMAVVSATRRSPLLTLGVSTRGGINWYRAAQAFALVQGRSYCEPDDFKRLAHAALAHRIVLSGNKDTLARTRAGAEQVLDEIVESIPIPL
jgi:MoxR-like ATPase